MAFILTLKMPFMLYAGEAELRRQLAVFFWALAVLLGTSLVLVKRLCL